MKRLVFLSITALGISSIVTQMVMIREFLKIFSGNELVIGIILSLWLLLTGLGSFLGKYADRVRNRYRLLAVAQILIAILPFIHLIAIRWLPSLFTVGSEFNPLQIILIVGIVLLPYCIISGFLLPLACVVLAKGKRSVGLVYFVDNIGDILGGLLFTFVLIFIFNHVQSLLFVFAINIIAAILISWYCKIRFLSFLSAILLIIVAILSVGLETETAQWLYPGQRLIDSVESKYGNIAVTELDGQLNIYENGIVTFAEGNVIQREAVHFAMAQRDNINSVLLISGGIGGTPEEVFKHGYSHINYVELDPEIITIAEDYGVFTPYAFMATVEGDGRLWLEKGNRYDVIIASVPAPSSAGLNRFYTVEYFREVKESLASNGVYQFTLPGQENYLEGPTQELLSSIIASVESVFEYTLIIPGDDFIVLASDGELSTELSLMLGQKGVDTEYVSDAYLKPQLDRMEFVRSSLNPDAKLNKDFKPVGYFLNTKLWLEKVGYTGLIIVGIILLAIIVYAIRLGKFEFTIFSTGFASMGTMMILVYAFQAIYGYIYSEISLMVTLFMIGLAVGSYYIVHRKDSANIVKRIDLSVLTLLIVIPFALLLVKDYFVLWSADIIFPLLLLVMAIFTGGQFAEVSRFMKRSVSETSSRLYVADLTGAAAGALLISIFAIPLLGIYASCGVMIFLKLISISKI